MTVLAWLPALACISGPIDRIIPQLYAVFHRDVVLGNPRFRTRPVWWDRTPTGVFGFLYEGGFWHLVSRDYYQWTSSGRVRHRDFDPARAERLPWFAPVLCHADAEGVLTWDYLEAHGTVNTYVWLESSDYVIVLQRRAQKKGDIFFLTTAYHVDGDSIRAMLTRKYEKRVV